MIMEKFGILLTRLSPVSTRNNRNPSHRSDNHVQRSRLNSCRARLWCYICHGTNTLRGMALSVSAKHESVLYHILIIDSLDALKAYHSVMMLDHYSLYCHFQLDTIFTNRSSVFTQPRPLTYISGSLAQSLCTRDPRRCWIQQTSSEWIGHRKVQIAVWKDVNEKMVKR